MAATDEIRRDLRDVVLTHAHLDHIAGLPLFIDDLFATLTEPVTIHALEDVIEILERDVFNWSVFPKFSELRNNGVHAVAYRSVRFGTDFDVAGLKFRLIPADHKVPSAGVLVRDERSAIAISGDTASLAGIKTCIEDFGRVDAILVECAFPNELSQIAQNSHHMTPAVLAKELASIQPDCPVYVVNIKPSYRDAVVRQLEDLNIDGLELMMVGKTYLW